MASLRLPLAVLASAPLALGLTSCASPTTSPGTSETVVSAVVRAESDAGGRAVDLDRDDDGTWEVRVAANGGDTDLRISADGGEVLSRDAADALDAADRTALENAGTTMADAVRTAVAAHGGGSVEEVEIESASGAPVWQVSFDDGVDVAISLSDGSVVTDAP
ncbi:predicted membrane protein [Microbacterium testaceum StLB037]|uniref:Predicted membrane protein n=1 Tax=Microbacterium testaceum (strain StLB037) TaxID=979556 RepID=E8NED4_MICTS|nr:PepSY domain-containing protein [Microbacterium testaceum]BAJ73800.1 predicted membrane protein [Microbacterium testaceum StLB037]